MFKILPCILALGLFGAAPAQAKVVYTDFATWDTAVAETYDYTENFEALTDGALYGGTATMTLTPLNAFTGANFYVESGAGSIGGSNPIGNNALELPDSPGMIARLDFSIPITYFGFYYIDAGSPTIDATTFGSTGASGDSALFGGFLFDTSENKTSIVISSVSGDGTWGLDNLMWGSSEIPPVPLPAALPLLLAGLGALGAARAGRRR